jgi:hypothetical protein
MKAFNVQAARRDGLSDAQIADLLASDYGVDLSAARQNGLTDSAILDTLVQLDRRTVANNQEAARNTARTPAPDVAKMDGLKRFQLGVGQGMTDLALGARQIAGFADAGEAERKRAEDAELMGTTAGKVGSIVGKVLPAIAAPAGALSGVVGRGVQGVGMLANSGSTVNAGVRIAGSGVLDSALAGLGLGALEPVSADQSRAANAATGAAIGAAVPAAIGVARGIRGAAAPFTEAGQQRIAAEALRGMTTNQAATMRALANPPPSVRGVTPTTAAVSGDLGLATAEKTARGLDPAGFAGIDMANNAARVKALQGVAGTADDIVAAEAARKAAALPLLREARQVSGGAVDNTRVLGAIDTVLAGPARKREGVVNALQFIRNKVDDPNLSFDDLYAVRKELGDLMTGKMGQADKFTGVREATRELNAVKRQIDQALNQASGGQFGQYTRAWSAGSRPIEQMKAGQEILAKAEARAVDATGNPRLRSGDIRSFMVRKGAGRFGPVFSDEQQGTLRLIADDIDRGNIVDSVRPRGSDTFQNLAQNAAWNRATGGQPMPQWMEATVNRIGRYVYGNLDATVQRRVIEALQDPAKAAQLYQLMPDEASKQALNRWLQEVGQTAAVRLPQAVTAGHVSRENR